MAVRLGLPGLECMFNTSGTAYAAGSATNPIDSRFVFWFNGNGIPEKYWIPQETGADYQITPCLQPLAPLKKDISILTGMDSPAARLPQPGNSHYPSMSALLTGREFTGRGAGGPSIDQAIASKIGGETRFRSLQVGVCQESFGEAIQRNMSWADRDRPLPPEMLPHRFFDRVFGVKDSQWIDRQKSILDVVREQAKSLKQDLSASDQARLDEYLTSVRELERSIASLPPEYREVVERPSEGGDLKDWPRIAKLQSDLLVHALATRQTRVATYMLTKCQSLVRMPWLGYTALRHHDYTHNKATTPQSQRVMRDICRWHAEEFSYLLAKLKSIKEGDRTLLDSTCALYVHEHAEANSHKCNGLVAIVAGHANGKIATGRHTKVAGTMGDLYLALANGVLGAGVESFPTAAKSLPGIAL